MAKDDAVGVLDGGHGSLSPLVGFAKKRQGLNAETNDN